MVLHEDDAGHGFVAVAPKDHLFLNLAGETEAGVGVIDEQGCGAQGEDLVVDGAAIGELTGARGGGDLIDDDGVNVNGNAHGGVEGEQPGEEGGVLVGLGAELGVQLGTGEVLGEHGVVSDNLVHALEIEVDKIGGLELCQVSAAPGDGDSGIVDAGGQGAFLGKDEPRRMAPERLAEGQDFIDEGIRHERSLPFNRQRARKGQPICRAGRMGMGGIEVTSPIPLIPQPEQALIDCRRCLGSFGRGIEGCSGVIQPPLKPVHFWNRRSDGLSQLALEFVPLHGEGVILVG